MLEIEWKLGIIITMPQLCYFCGEEIVKRYGRDSDSLLFHSLDENHNNWDPENKVPAHRRCHMSFHNSGERNVQYGKHGNEISSGFSGRTHTEESKRKIGDFNRGKKFSDETRKRISESMLGYVKTEEHRKNISNGLMEYYRKKSKE